MSRYLLFAFAFVATPAFAQEEAGDEAAETSPEAAPAGGPTAGGGVPMDLGLEVGEPTALRFALGLTSAGRLYTRIGLLHRAQPFGFAMAPPNFGLGYEHDLVSLGTMLGRKASLTVGFGINAWAQSAAIRLRPLFGVELPIGIRLAGDSSPLSMHATVAPQLDIVPAMTPAVVASFGFSWRLSGAAAAPAPEPVPAPEVVEPEPEAEKAKPAKKAKPKRSVRPKRRKR